MRLTIFVIVICSLSLSCKQQKKTANFSNGKPVPKSIGWVNDFDRIFTEEEEKQLNNYLDSFEKQTSYEVAVVTIDTTIVGRLENDMFDITLELAKNWGVGKLDKNNGVLIGVCVGRRKIQIQNGKGTESVMSDLQTKKFIDSVFMPYYANGQYFRGTFEGVKAITTFLGDNKKPTK